MAKDRSLVRASDIGAWAFCNRAWWLANVRKEAHGNPQALAQGNIAHGRHGRHVASAQRYRRVGIVLIGAALLLAGLFLLAWMLWG